MHIKNPKAIINHQSQEFSFEANSVECFTMKVHLAKDKPKPDNAPYREATDEKKHAKIKNPIQLNMKEITNADMNIKSVPSKLLSFDELGLLSFASTDRNVKGCWSKPDIPMSICGDNISSANPIE